MNTVEWLSRLVAFDTTSRYSNLDLIQTIQDWLARYHIETRFTYDLKEKKANLFATLPAQNGSVDGGIILSGHTDVVPVDGQHWDTNPFEAVLMNDRIYGRGTCDMKGFLAVALTLLPEFQQMKLSEPVHFAFTYDEEVGCRGVPLLLADLQQAGIRPKACIVGEPTEMKPVVAHKGIQGFRCRLNGRAAHSSLTPQGCNAIEHAARLICHIRDLADEMRRKGPFDSHFDVPFTSISTNMIHGGNAHNTIPALCEFIFEFRHLPHVKPQQIREQIEIYIQNELLPKMRNEYPDASVELDSLSVVPSFEVLEASAITLLARHISNEKTIHKVAYATEAGLFQQADIPTIVCGPGNIEQAHRQNEFVTLDQLGKCEVFLRKVVSEFARVT
ncbi:acetylornithine deacetylase [Aquicella lusitana]|uniref:Acetylornithine deacetylase n=1 Tax=Aquicella lusitana TaxID=254246 RepID=A0A370GN74_9COXI|nr:acetylornithine deacetylase [Aquicella lusitana]RDI45172.1 acetylornithine deacetylase [Aquicella lusitana]VVC72758.1 Acetylornithine deacetylase [Aquicella lusitana]